MTTVAVSLKMYFGAARAQAYCSALAALAARHPLVASGATELVVLPSFLAIPGALEAAGSTRLRVGAQDLATEDSGAFTGEVSGAELAELGVTHVEVGHAERRRLFGEDDSMVRAKTQAALRNGLVPLLCVGEAERTDPVNAAAVVVDQVGSAIPDGSSQRVLVAYEPVWAIGAEQPAPPAYTAAVCRAVRVGLGDRLGDVGIIYGGSAGPGLVAALGDSVDGLFLGRFAHDPTAVELVLDEVSAAR
jgi:triosephosphate isomerase (TIM)